jgi:hypothetical protein
VHGCLRESPPLRELSPVGEIARFLWYSSKDGFVGGVGVTGSVNLNRGPLRNLPIRLNFGATGALEGAIIVPSQSYSTGRRGLFLNLGSVDEAAIGTIDAKVYAGAVFNQGDAAYSGGPQRAYQIVLAYEAVGVALAVQIPEGTRLWDPNVQHMISVGPAAGYGISASTSRSYSYNIICNEEFLKRC